MPTVSDARIDEALDGALARAVVWRRLARGFLPPGTAPVPPAEDDTERRALTGALEQLGLSPFDHAASDHLHPRFAELFGHTPRAAVCPYETEYGTGRVFRQTQELADLQGWYRAFGLTRRTEVAERADHIGVECDFAGFLCLKEAACLQEEDDDQLQVVLHAYRRFLRAHLAQFGIAVSLAIERADGGGPYGRLGGLCRELLFAECGRLGIEPGPRALPLRDDGADDGVAAACGADVSCAPKCEGASPLGRASRRRLLSIGEGD